MKSFFSILLCFFSLVAFSQEPTILSLKGYGGNGVDQVLPNVTKTSDGGFIICIQSNSDSGTGNIDSFCSMGGGRSIFLKYNADASIMKWSKCFRDGPYIFPQLDGTYILGGSTPAVPSGWAFKLLKVDSNENILWRKTYGGEAASAILNSMIATNDACFIMCGQTYYTDTDFTTHYGSNSLADIGIIKVDSNGNKLWSKVIGGSNDDNVYTIINAPNNGFYIFGGTLSNDYDCIGNHGNIDAYLARFDSNGNILWHHDLGGSNDDSYYGWAVTNNKGGVLIATGSISTDGEVHYNIGGQYNYWVLEVDSSNNILWDNCYGSTTSYVFPTSICKATDGSIWVTGESSLKGGEVDTSYGNGDAWIVHADSVGNFLNGKVLGSSGDDMGQMVYPLSDGFVITGAIYNKNNCSLSSITEYGVIDAFIAKLAPWNTIVDKISMDNNINIYPNPTKNYIYISNINIEITVSVLNITGQQIYNKVINKNNLQINVSNWNRGIYFVEIKDNTGQIYVNKILKQ